MTLQGGLAVLSWVNTRPVINSSGSFYANIHGRDPPEFLVSRFDLTIGFAIPGKLSRLYLG